MLPDSSGSWNNERHIKIHPKEGEHESKDNRLAGGRPTASSGSTAGTSPGNSSRRPSALFTDFFVQLSSCCCGSAKPATPANHKVTAEEFLLIDLVAANHPDVLVALDIFELAAKLSNESPHLTVAASASQSAVAFSQILIRHGRLPHGTEVAAAVEQALRRALLPEVKIISNKSSESFEPQVGGPATTTLRMVSDLTPGKATMPPPSAAALPQDVVSLCQTLPIDPVHLYDLTAAVMNAAFKPFILLTGTTKLLGALWWAESILRGRKLSRSLLDRLAHRMLVHEYSSATATGKRHNRYAQPPSFTAIQSMHEEFNVFECIRSVNVKGPEDILADWRALTERTNRENRVHFLIFKKGSSVCAVSFLLSGDVRRIKLIDIGSVDPGSIQTESEPIKRPGASKNSYIWRYRDMKMINCDDQPDLADRNLISLAASDPDLQNRNLTATCLIIVSRMSHEEASEKVPVQASESWKFEEIQQPISSNAQNRDEIEATRARMMALTEHGA